MDAVRIEDFRRLSSPQTGWCVSLYLPTHVGGVVGEEDAPRLGRLLDRAQEQLVDHGMRTPEARGMLAAARNLPTTVGFWKRRQRSLAMFVGDNGFRAFRLPLDLREELTVGHKFRVKPLVSLLSGEDAFYVLALSQKHVRLVAATRYSAEEIAVPGLDQSLRDALGEETADRGEQVHSGANLTAGMGTSRKQAGVFHGHGGHRETAKDDVTRFFRTVDEKLHNTLRDQHAPLVLAAVDYLLPLFRDVCTYPHLLADGVAGNCDLASAAELRDRAWPVVEPTLRQSRATMEMRYREAGGARRFAVSELSGVLAAAAVGRIAALFVDPRHEVRGAFDEASGELTLYDEPKGDDDLVEQAIAQTLLKRGIVYPLDDENQGAVDAPLCALLRY